MKNADKNIFLLSDSSWLIHDDKDDIGFEAMKNTYDGFIKATVPGNIQDDLEKAHLLSHPIWSDGFDQKLYAVATKYWWYKKEFVIPKNLKGRRLTLYFGGVDFACDVYFNDTLLGHHEGAFERFDYDITSLAKVGELNALWVKIDKMPDDFLPWIIDSDGAMSGLYVGHFFAPGNNLLREMLKGMKSPANLSYDWGTNIYTLGLWKDVYIKATGSIRIDWMQAKTHFNDDKYKNCTVEALLEIDSTEDCEVSVNINVSGNGLKRYANFKTHLRPGKNTLSGYVDVSDPQLWWPNGYGEHPLYELSATITKDDSVSDSENTRFGFRDIKWAHCEGCPEDFPFKYRLIMNGTPIRMIGSNLTAVDLVFGRIGNRGRHFIEMAQKCNFNMLRFHGGSWGHHDAIYDDCDELGIMVSNEYPVGNWCIVPDPVLMDNFDRTCANLVRQLRNHPSIIEWGGGNELEWYYNKNADRTAMFRMEKVTNEADDTRLFRYTCPVPGSRHAPWDYNPEIHYKMYNSDWPDNFENDFCMRFGEFSTQSNAHPEVWYRDIADKDRWPIDEKNEVQIKKNIVESVFTPNVWWYKDRMEKFFYRIDNLEMGIKGGQWMGAEGIRYAVDALRSKGRILGGLSTWDFNEPWPNGGGPNVIDYDGRPFMAYYFLKQACAPLSITLKYSDILYDMSSEDFAEVILNCDTPAPAKDLTWHYTLMDRHGRTYSEEEGKCDISPMEVKKVAKFKIQPCVNMIFGPVICLLSLKNAKGEIINDRVYIFGNKATMGPLRGLLADGCPDHGYDGRWAISNIMGGPIDKTSIEIENISFTDKKGVQTAQITLKNTASSGVPALFCEIRPKIEYLPMIQFSENFITIPAGESRTVTAVLKDGTGLLKMSQAGFIVDCWNAPSVYYAPDKTVVLSVGRKDDTNRGFDAPLGDTVIKTKEREVDASLVPYMIKDSTLQILFKTTHVIAAKLIISTTDTDPAGMGRLEVSLNGFKTTARIPEGAGFQEADRSRRAYSKDLVFDIPEKILNKNANNVLKISASFGYIALDSIKIITK